jgi:PIN domain nuclease of toxin-antitoxin system
LFFHPFPAQITLKCTLTYNHTALTHNIRIFLESDQNDLGVCEVSTWETSFKS